jgi:hypothetical protein
MTFTRIALWFFLLVLSSSEVGALPQRPFPRPDDNSIELIVPDGTVFCAIGGAQETFLDSMELLSQIRFRGGSHRLPTDATSFERDLIREIRLGPEKTLAVPMERGQFLHDIDGDEHQYVYSQSFNVSGATLTVMGPNFRIGSGVRSYRLDVENEFVLASLDNYWSLLYQKCGFETNTTYIIDLTLANGGRIALHERRLVVSAGFPPASLVLAEVELPEGSVDQDDYWKLVSLGPNSYWVLFDSPLGGIHGIQITNFGYNPRGGYEVAHLDENLEPFKEVNVVTENRYRAEGIFVNEVMPSNHSTAMDEAGDFDPWIEIHNLKDKVFDLEGYFLSNSRETLRAWPFPAGAQIEPMGYVTVWADNEPAEGPLHATFELETRGGSLLLKDSPSSSYTKIIDSVQYGLSRQDISQGRYPDASGRWGDLDLPTPGASNSPLAPRNFDTRPQGWPDGRVNASDLLQVFRNVEDGTDTGRVFLDFSRSWNPDS